MLINLQLTALSRYFFFQAEDGIRDRDVTGVQTCALPISRGSISAWRASSSSSPEMRDARGGDAWNDAVAGGALGSLMRHCLRAEGPTGPIPRLSGGMPKPPWTAVLIAPAGVAKRGAVGVPR